MARQRKKVSANKRHPPSDSQRQLLKREREQHKETLARERATSEILRVIVESQTDVQPVFDTIVRNAVRLCGGIFANAFRYDGEQLHLVATTHKSVEGLKILADTYPMRPHERQSSGRAILAKATVKIKDALTDPAYDHRHAIAGSFRRTLAVPMLRSGEPIGVIVVAWAKPGPISERQEQLLQTFADQAVIAVENVRLFNETKEALERQTATSELLKVIGEATSDLQPVFDTLAENAVKVCRAGQAFIFRFDRRFLRVVASCNVSPELKRFFADNPIAPGRGTVAGRAAAEGRTIHVHDVRSDPEYGWTAHRVDPIRTVLTVPMTRGGEVLGVIGVNRSEVRPFSEHEIELLQTFADQAVIAIENVRLFNETKEALERQTATSDILRVISRSPGDIAPVLDTILERGLRLCEARHGSVFTFDGEAFRVARSSGQLRPEFADRLKSAAISPGRETPLRRVGLELRPVHCIDLLNDPSYSPPPEYAQEGFGTALAVPVLKEGKLIGALAFHRREIRPFSERQIALLQTFADQAAIAIENTRLFNETKEALARQTATAEMLKVIAGLPSDEQPVFDAIVAHAGQIVGGCSVNVSRLVGDKLYLAAYSRISPEADALLKSFYPISATEARPLAEAVRRRESFYVGDFQSEPNVSRMAREVMRARGFRSTLYVPIVRGDAVYGVMHVSKVEPGPFPENWVEILKIFADQAVIAIENVRLFKEIQEKSAQLETASRHKSQFLASMSHELRTPLNAILGFNEMMLDGLCGEVPAGFKDPLDETQKSGKHLLRLINNVLDLAKIEAGRMELALADYSVHDTVESVRSTLRPLAAEKGLEFLANVPADIPLAYGDAGRITQCLMNLAGNSLKFTKEGRVEISVQQQNGQLRYCVTDTGIGIPPEKIGSLFTEFKQTDATIASEYGGTGLGLSITKKFVEMHGGRIWVESEIGKGSAFIFEIPVKPGQ